MVWREGIRRLRTIHRHDRVRDQVGTLITYGPVRARESGHERGVSGAHCGPAGATGLTYDDLLDFPDDHLRRELIDGELYVTPPPLIAHQHAVMVLSARLFAYEREGVAEFWFVDLDVPCIDVHRLHDAVYGAPETFEPGQQLTTPLLPGFALDVAEVFDAGP